MSNQPVMRYMYIRSLSVTSFRNFSSLRVEFGEGVNIFTGDNGTGKTNLLEAIHILCLGRSQRGAGDQVLLRSEAEAYHLKGRLVADAETLDVTTAYQRGGRKKLTIDGLSAKLSELYHRVSVVSAGPEDSAIVAGSPSQRRAFMDIYISQLNVSYLANLSDYQRAVAQKNAALKSQRDATPFDTIMIESGSRIMRDRGSFLKRLGGLAGEYYRRMSGGERLAVEYRPSVEFDQEGTELGDINDAMEARLQVMRHREDVIQTALVGPHRDDILFAIDGLPARSHGSQGQWRSCAIALKMAVYELLKERRGQAPILLLDEVFAELDQKRADTLIDAFSELGQLFLTTALTPPNRLRERSCNYRVAHGSVEGE